MIIFSLQKMQKRLLTYSLNLHVPRTCDSSKAKDSKLLREAAKRVGGGVNCKGRATKITRKEIPKKNVATKHEGVRP